MKLTPSGRTAIPRRRIAKNPHKIAVGVARAAAALEQGWDPKVRSSRLGYDCYSTGAINGAGKIRIVLRVRRLPPHLTSDIIGQLPSEMWWPDRDHKAAHALIDAIIGFDIGAMNSWRACWPGHEFGFERFLDFLTRRAAHVRSASTPLNSVNSPIIPDEPADRGHKLPHQFSLFPSEIDSQEKLYASTLEASTGANYILRMSLIRFTDGTGALCTEIYGMLAPGLMKGAMLCSRAFSDLNTGEYEIVAHRPGRLQGLNLPIDLLHTHLGIKSGHALKPTTRRLDSERVAPVRTSPNESTPMLAARHLQAVLAGDGPTASRYVEPPHASLPLTGAPGEQDSEPVRFPDAPT